MEKNILFESIVLIAKDIKSKHLLLFFGILTFSIFWFCAIYLIANSFYKTNPIFISCMLSFILSTIWYIANCIPSALVVILMLQNKSFTGDEKDEAVLFDAFIYSSLTASFCLFVFYNLAPEYSTFKYFLLSCFFLVFVRILIILGFKKTFQLLLG